MDNNTTRTMAKVIAGIITFHLSLAVSQAQTFTQRLTKPDPVTTATITIHEDPAIDELVNTRNISQTRNTGTTASNSGKKQQGGTAKAEDKNGAKKDDAHAADTRTTHAEEQPNDSITQPTAPPRRMRQVQGYRVQVFAGGSSRADHNKAEQMKNTLKALFPDKEVYVRYLSTRWTCRIGDFRSMGEAMELYRELVKMGYDTSSIVRGKVNVPY